MFDNTVGSLDSLPVEIQEYYEEDIRTEPTGEMVSEEYTYTDDKGTKQTATRDVPETTEVTYLVLKSFGHCQDSVSLTLSQGKPEHVVLKHLELANNMRHSTFHADFITWMLNEPPVVERARDENGTFISDDPETDLAEHYVNGITPEMRADALAAWEKSKPVLSPEIKLEHYSEYRTWRKMKGVEFNGVMCSASGKDFWGIAATEAWIREGNSTEFEFRNGNKVALNAGNIDDFLAVWMPFRQGFFNNE